MESLLWEEPIKEFHYIPSQIIRVCLVFRRDKEYIDTVENRFISFLLKKKKLLFHFDY